MGIPVSLLLIAGGAILTWGVTEEPSGLNLDAIGVILMVIGIVGLVLTLLLWQSWWGPGYWRRATYVDDAAGPAVVLGRPQKDDVRRGRRPTATRQRTASSVELDCVECPVPESPLVRSERRRRASGRLLRRASRRRRSRALPA